MRRATTPTFAALGLCLLLALSACAARSGLPPVASVQVDGAALDYRDLGGSGRPLLLLTGYAVTMDMWDQDFVRALAAEHRVILMDNRGMGPSKAPAGPISIRRMARDAIGLLDALHIPKADILGWSMGGIIAQEMALQRPDLVGSLILCATLDDTGTLMPVLDKMAAMRPDELRQAMFPKAWTAAHPETLAHLPARTRPPDLDVIARQYAALGHWPGTRRALPTLGCPVLLLGGSEDWVCPPDQLQNMARNIPGARLELLMGGGHWMMHQFPRQMAGLVNEFLEDAPATPPARHATASRTSPAPSPAL